MVFQQIERIECSGRKKKVSRFWSQVFLVTRALVSFQFSQCYRRFFLRAFYFFLSIQSKTLTTKFQAQGLHKIVHNCTYNVYCHLHVLAALTSSCPYVNVFQVSETKNKRKKRQNKMKSKMNETEIALISSIFFSIEIKRFLLLKQQFIFSCFKNDEVYVFHQFCFFLVRKRNINTKMKKKKSIWNEFSIERRSWFDQKLFFCELMHRIHSKTRMERIVQSVMRGWEQFSG